MASGRVASWLEMKVPASVPSIRPGAMARTMFQRTTP